MIEPLVVLYAALIWMRLIFGVVLMVAALLAAFAWAERTRRLNPFSAPARWARRLDPLIAPVERRLGRFGVTHANAPWWALLVLLLIAAALTGLVGFVRDVVSSIYLAMDKGPRGMLYFGVSSVITIMQFALIGRVIMSWIGGTYSRLGRLAYALTEWYLGPLRRVLPSIGMVDISPMVAYFVLSMLRPVLATVLWS